MSEPVTRRELHEALETWAGAIQESLKRQFKELFDEQFLELRALIKTTESNLIARIEASLDPYRDVPARVSALEAEALPQRVSKLEAKVFAPRRRARRSRPG